MAKTDTQIVSEIKNYVGYDSYRNWYAGIASDPRARLFNDHCVDEHNGLWVYDIALNEQHARSAENALLSSGFDGGNGGGDNTTVWVYAYKKGSNTQEKQVDGKAGRIIESLRNSLNGF